MIFKNIRLFRLTKPLQHSAESLHDILLERAFVACDSYQLSSFGWIEPLGKHGKQLVHQTGRQLMICACKEERLLPASVLRDTVEEEVELIETEQARRVFPSEKRRLKEDAVQRLLPRAFTKKRLIYGYLDLDNHWLIIDSATTKLADEFTQLLRQSLGSLPIVPLICQQEPNAVMTHWLLKNSLPTEFTTGDDCVLKDKGDDKVSLRSKGIDISSPDYTNYLAGGMRVNKLSLCWQNQLEFNLADDLCLSRIRFNDLVKEQDGQFDIDDFAGRFDSDFALMSGTFTELVKTLVDSFGGIDESIE